MYPATEKPAVAELNTGHTVGAAVTMCAAMLAGELMPRDCAGNVLPLSLMSGSTYGSVAGAGEMPTVAASMFTLSGHDGAALRFVWGNRALVWQGRASTALPRTLFIIFRHNLAQATNTAYNTRVFTQSATASLAYGLMLRAETDGTFSLGFDRNSSFIDAGVNLTANHWYAVALTLTDTTHVTIQVYDYTDQATLTTYRPASITAWSTTTDDAQLTLNHYGTFIGDVYQCGFATESWDPLVVGKENHFADWINDPNGLVTGAYAPEAGTLVAGGSRQARATATSISVQAARPTGGDSEGVYTYQWQRCVADPTNANNWIDLDGKTSLACTDTTAVAGTPYLYRCKQMDATATVYTRMVPGMLIRGVATIGIIGDSLGQAAAFTIALANVAMANGVVLNVVNRAVGGTFATSGTLSLSWQPGNTLLTDALDAFSKSGVTHVIGIVGANDANTNLSVVTFSTAINAIATAVVAAGYSFIYYPTPANYASDNGLMRTWEYRTVSVSNGTTKHNGNYRSFDGTARIAGLIYDTLHPQQYIVQALAVWRSLSGILGFGEVPDAADVRSGESYDAAYSTGTLDLPAVGNVKLGTQFDGTTKTGTYPPGGGGKSHLSHVLGSLLLLCMMLLQGCTCAVSKDLYYFRLSSIFKADDVEVETPTVKAKLKNLDSRPDLKVIEKALDKIPGGF